MHVGRTYVKTMGMTVAKNQGSKPAKNPGTFEVLLFVLLIHAHPFTHFTQV